MPSPSTLRAAAGTLRAQAAAASSLLDDVTRIASDDLWSGPIAERFHDELYHHRGQMRTVHDDLIRTAQQLEARADAIEERERQERLARLEAVSEPSPQPKPAPSSSQHRFIE